MTEAQSKKRLLILGSGFSKAVSDKMPVVRELADALKKQIKEDPELKELEDPRYQHLLNDPELLLTYLAQDQPWKEPWETPREWALFLKISRWLAKYIADCEGKAFKEESALIPEWAKRLASWLHQTKARAITFNYDTVLERICFLHVEVQLEDWMYTFYRLPPDYPRNLAAFNLYQMPLALIQHREAAGHSIPQSTFHLVKLHGSINWFYSGNENLPSEQIYFREVTSRDPDKERI